MTNISLINESFSKIYEATEEIPINPIRKALENALDRLALKQEINIKAYEHAFQDALEKQFPETPWWEITDCNIFWDLFEGRNPSKTIDHIMDKLKPEYKDDDNLKESVESDDYYIVNYSREGAYDYRVIVKANSVDNAINKVIEYKKKNNQPIDPEGILATKLTDSAFNELRRKGMSVIE